MKRVSESDNTAVAQQKCLMLESIIQNADSPMFALDSDYRYLFFNRSHAAAMNALYSVRVETDVCMLDYLTAAEDRVSMQHNLDRTLGGEPLVVEMFMGADEPTRGYWQVAYKPIRSTEERITGVTVFMQDLTARRREEEALRNNAEIFRIIFERSTMGKVITAPDGMLLQLNETFANLLGYSIAEMKRFNFADITHPDDIAESQARMQAMFASYDATCRVEKRYLHKNGKIIWADVSSTLMRDSTGAPLYFITSIADISERKHAEEQLRKFAAELQRSNQELEQFAYVASHDLHEPLRMIAGYTQLLARRYQGQLDANADEYIGYVVDGVKRMQGLISDLLLYARVTTHGKPFAPTDCNQVLAQSLANLQVAIAESGATVTSDPLPVVMADANQLIQLFQNLIANAVKFHGQEAPQVHVSARKAQWASADAETVDGWEFAVRDNGIGIDPLFAERIFVVFQRLHTRSEYPGTGVGLAIAKRIIERHGGRIWVESQPGHGAAFYFDIPAEAL